MRPPYVKIGDEVAAEAELKKKGQWTLAGIEQSVGWTKKSATIEYDGRTFVLLAETEKLMAAIALREPPEKGRLAILQFVGALAWVENGTIAIDGWSGGSQPFRIGKGPGARIVADRFQVDYLPLPIDQKQKLALAMYQEGRSLAHVHVAYSFLSFFKIINLIAGARGKQQVAWINAHLSDLAKVTQSGRLKELENEHANVGEYLYQSGRCAIAHAHLGDPDSPVIDPHNIEDQKRLYADLPLMIELSQIAIEKELGIKTTHTVYKERTYQLSGFEEFLGTELVSQLKAGETPTSGNYSIPGTLDMRLWGKKPYSVFQGMTPQSATVNKGVFVIPCISKSNRYIVGLFLDFPKNTLSFRIGNPPTYLDDGTPESMEEMIEVNEFEFDHFCNGKFEVWSEDECLARCDAFMPLNMMPDPKGHEAQRKHLQEEVVRRRAKTDLPKT